MKHWSPSDPLQVRKSSSTHDYERDRTPYVSPVEKVRRELAGETPAAPAKSEPRPVNGRGNLDRAAAFLAAAGVTLAAFPSRRGLRLLVRDDWNDRTIFDGGLTDAGVREFSTETHFDDADHRGVRPDILTDEEQLRSIQTRTRTRGTGMDRFRILWHATVGNALARLDSDRGYASSNESPARSRRAKNPFPTFPAGEGKQWASSTPVDQGVVNAFMAIARLLGDDDVGMYQHILRDEGLHFQESMIPPDLYDTANMAESLAWLVNHAEFDDKVRALWEMVPRDPTQADGPEGYQPWIDTIARVFQISDEEAGQAHVRLMARMGAMADDGEELDPHDAPRSFIAGSRIRRN